jgi:radical SAM superfamily enzyme YgiQ (UPF0313 family)
VAGKFVLVNVPSSENAYHNLIDFVAVFPPVGIASIAAVIERMGRPVSILDADARMLSLDQTVDAVVAETPAYVGLTGMTAVMDIVGKFVARLKARCPAVQVIIGGPHPSAIPERTLQDFPGIDVAVIGEGDETIEELLPALESGADLGSIAGIAFRRDGVPVRTAPRPPIRDLGKTPIPAYHLLDMSLYRSYGWNQWVSGHRRPLGVVFTGRGCYGECNFCASHCVFGRGIRFYPTERIREEIELFVRHYDIRVLYFQDDTFTANRKVVNDVCDFLIERGYNRRIEIMVSARVDTVHGPTLRKMREAGIRWICFGVESGNQDILDRMGKHITLEQIRRAFALAREAGLFVAGNFMIGHIGETRETAMDTIRLACELPEEYASFAIAIPFPGSEIYRHCVVNGIPLPNWGAFGSVNSPPIPLNPDLGVGELMELRRLATDRFFKRPGYLWHMVRVFNAPAVTRDFVKMYFALRAEQREKRF